MLILICRGFSGKIKYSISGKGLLITKQFFLWENSITIPWENLSEKVTIGKTFKSDILNSLFVIIVLGLLRFYYCKSFEDIWIVFLFGIFAIVLGIAFSFPKMGSREQEYRVLLCFPKKINDRMDEFLSHLFETRNYVLHFREKDSVEKTGLEKQFLETISLFHSGEITEQQFHKRFQVLKFSSTLDESRKNPFYN